MKTTFLIIILILTLILISNLYSQEIPYGEEFRINSNTKCTQGEPSIAGLQDGGFIVCWNSTSQEGVRDVYGQLFDSTFSKIGSEFPVTTYAWASNSSIALLKDGSFVVCWESGHNPLDGCLSDIYGQIFNSVGEKKGAAFHVNTFIEDYQTNPSVAGLQNGGFVVCWDSWPVVGHAGQDGSGAGIFAQIFSSSGVKVGNEFQANTYTDGNQWFPAVASLNNGGFVVCWSNSCQLFDVSGNKLGVEIELNCIKKGNHPAIAGLSNGDFVVCWISPSRGYYNYCQIFDATCTPKSNEIQVNTYIPHHDEKFPSIAALTNGGFVICWESYGQNTTSSIFGQWFNVNGVKQGNNFLISNLADKRKTQSVVAKLQNDKILVCWTSISLDDYHQDIYGKYFLSEPIIHSLKEYSLSEPINDATLKVTHPAFVWTQPSSIRECYPWELVFNLYIDTDINFSNPQVIKEIQDTTYAIDSLEPGKTYFWKVLAKNLAGDSLWSTQQDWGFFISHNATSVKTADENVPQQFELFQNYPNPFNSSTEIKYSLPKDKSSYHVTLKIYDMRGRLVNNLVNQNQADETYSVRWNGRDMIGQSVSSGIYYYALQVGEYMAGKKMLLLK